MASGDVTAATAGATDDVFSVDTGMYDTDGYGAVYVIRGERPALVDAGIGTDTEVILDALAELGIAPADLASIVPTHVHLDHAGGAGFLAEACPNADVYVHERGARHLVDPGRLWEGTKAAVGDQIRYYAEPEPVSAARLVELTDGDRIGVGDRTIEVHHVPGHAPHQTAFYDPASDGLFTGDAAGVYTPGLDGPHPTSPPPDFDLAQCLADVERLQDVDPAALYYSHFGDAPADGLLAEYASVLEAWVDEVRAVRDGLDDEVADDELFDAVVEHFVGEGRGADAWGAEKARAETAMNVRGVLAYLDRVES